MQIFDFVACLVFGLFVSAGLISNVVSGSSAGHLRDIILKSGLVGTLIGLVATLAMLNEPEGLLVAFNIAVLPIVYGWVLVGLHWLFVRGGQAAKAKTISTGMAILTPSLWIATCMGAILYCGRYWVFFDKDAALAIAIGVYGLFVFASRDSKRDALQLVAQYLPILGLLILGACSLFLATMGVASDAGPAASIGLLALLYSTVCCIHGYIYTLIADLFQPNFVLCTLVWTCP